MSAALDIDRLEVDRLDIDRRRPGDRPSAGPRPALPHSEERTP